MPAIILHFLATVNEPWYSILNRMANAYFLFRKPERVTHPGTLHPDKTFYVIRDLPPDTGLASWYDRVVGYVMRAEKKGWTPIIDPLPPAQADDGNWYAFFKGLNEIPVEEALQGANVVFATTQAMIYKRYNRKNIARRHGVCKRIPLSDEARAFVDARLPGLFESIESPRVGVMFRGTDYRAHGDWCPVGHAKVPSYEDFCDRVLADLRRWGLPETGSNLFVVTEEQEALEAVRRRFPSARFVDKERFADFDFKGNTLFHRLPNTTPKVNNLLYLLDIIALSKCDYLIGGYNGCVLAALNMNGNRYQGVDIIRTGVN